jgi:hypothetical protein
VTAGTLLSKERFTDERLTPAAVSGAPRTPSTAILIFAILPDDKTSGQICPRVEQVFTGLQDAVVLQVSMVCVPILSTPEAVDLHKSTRSTGRIQLVVDIRLAPRLAPDHVVEPVPLIHWPSDFKSQITPLSTLAMIDRSSSCCGRDLRFYFFDNNCR